MTAPSNLLAEAQALQQAGFRAVEIAAMIQKIWQDEYPATPVELVRGRRGTLQLIFPGGERLCWSGKRWRLEGP
jgi:hypothetical protein